MLVGKTAVRIDSKAFRDELAALAVPSAVGPFLLGEDRTAGWAEKLGGLVSAGVIHMIHNSIIFHIPLIVTPRRNRGIQSFVRILPSRRSMPKRKTASETRFSKLMLHKAIGRTVPTGHLSQSGFGLQ